MINNITDLASTQGPTQETGFTLIELMISLVLGSLIIAGIFQVLISSNTVSRNTFAGNSIQEAGRFAMDFLTTDIAMAGSTRIYNANNASSTLAEGFRITLGPTIENPIVTTAMGTTTVTYPDKTTASIEVATTNNPSTDRLHVHGDTLVLRYYPPSARGCDGAAHTVGDLVTNVYWTRGSGEPAGGNTANAAGDSRDMDALYCFSFIGEAAPANVTVSPLVIGVERMEIQLLDSSQNRYREPEASIAGKDVEEVRIALLLRSKQTLNRDLATTPAKRQYQLLGTAYQASTDQSARLFRQVYQSSARVINRPAT